MLLEQFKASFPLNPFIKFDAFLCGMIIKMHSKKNVYETVHKLRIA